MTLRFAQPEWLLLLLLCVPVAAAGVKWFSAMSAVRRWSAVLLRVGLIALIAGMLAGATNVRQTDRMAVVALVDVSGSVQRFVEMGGTGRDEGEGGGRPTSALEGVRRFLNEAVAQRGPEDLLGIVVFDGTARALASPTRADVLDQPLDISMVEGTDIAQAIQLGAAMIPPDATGRLVLITDGVETTGDGLKAARQAEGGRLIGPTARSPPSASGARGSGFGDQGSGLSTRDPSPQTRDPMTAPTISRGRLPIDVVPLAYNVQHEVVVESVDAPPQAPAQATITVRVVLESTGHAQGTLQLLREGHPLDINGDQPGTGRHLILSVGRHVEQINVRLDAGTIHRFEAVFEPDPVRLPDGTAAYAGDTIAMNNRGQAVTLTPGKGSVLVVDGVSGGDPNGSGATLPHTLRDAGIDVQVVAPEGIPADLLALQAYDLVILQNVPADAVPRPVQSAIASYVSELGGGLVMVGGPDSFGAGGWKGTDIEPILPVRLDLPERLVSPAAAVILVLDNSGSMNRTVMGSTRSQQAVADEGAALAIQTLDKTDLVGVISFNADYTVEVPLGPNADSKATAERVRAISADGGTNMPPALEEARRQLLAVNAQVKHVIVLSDGQSMGLEQLPDQAGAMHSDGIMISTIAVGDQADEHTMQAMASRGGGQYYRVSDPNVLPRIFVKAIRIVRTPMVRESPFVPVVLPTGSPLVEALGQPPRLGGLVLTQARKDPTITYAMRHPQGEPLLAHWNVGLGRVAAFTSDASRWAAAWLDWPGYSRLWTQIARTMARPKADRSQELTVEIVGDELRIRLDAADQNAKPLDLLTVPAAVYLPDGQRVETRLTQTGPGVYEGAVSAPASGNYVVTLMPRLGTRRLPPVVGGVSRATGVEYRRLRSNIELLKQIAEATGGRVFDVRDGHAINLFDRTGVTPTEARLPLWRTLLLWAVIVLLLDVGTRRVAWDRFFSDEFRAALRREAAEAVRARGEQVAHTLGRLRGREQTLEAQQAMLSPEEAKLSTEDARQIVLAQAQRRRAARQARRVVEQIDEDTRPPPAPAPRPRATEQAPPTPPDQPAGESGDTTSGLLAAKRRARERLESDGSDRPQT